MWSFSKSNITYGTGCLYTIVSAIKACLEVSYSWRVLSPLSLNLVIQPTLVIRRIPVLPSFVVYGMISSANTNEQQDDPRRSTENWDNPVAVVTLDQVPSQYRSANRREWEWDPMILAQHPGSGGSTDDVDGDRMKNQISAGTMSSLRASYNFNMLSAGLPSNFTQNHMGIYSSAGIRTFGSLDGPAQVPTQPNTQSVHEPSGIPGLAAASGAGLENDIRCNDQRRREFFAAGMHNHHVKREKDNDGHSRIGLNLGVRTYFSTKETVANLGKRPTAGSPGSQVPMCQAEGCKADLSQAKQYHRRHKVCEHHSKALNVVANGQTQRFCQQCSRFHLLGEFDDGKRSCRKRLADHNRRRRKPQPNASAPGGTTAESPGMKREDNLSGFNRTNDSKTMNMPLKSRSSLSSVSIEDSDNQKPGSVGNNPNLRSSGKEYGRGAGDEKPQSRSGMQMSCQAVSGSEAQTLFSSMSTVPLMLQSTKKQRTMTEGTSNHGPDHSLHQHLQAGNSGQTGPNLSLSFFGGQMGRIHTMPNTTYNGMEPRVSWLRPSNTRSELTQVVGRLGSLNYQHLMSTDSKSGITSASANSSNSQEHDVQVYSPSSQNLIPCDIASPEWMLGTIPEWML
ncbi:uncharacterized protein [Physcomitrium patens]|uniref:SBP-type domain-containing protein n=1 Tax=Physcomitrium patens TaxID=3218 RepID=A0A7I4CRT1_PHYPA|nr:uncharacterized protein LOC112277409 [Physcomitrium patens]XP_024365406.1 uncharacterized protein LOC112277409 [Physcomitrium patens]XP_024365407.1 uncharacterized protein LOC112277409 [Physcomitrium patens]XP_024365409.1 uncharacterized protein LOC112277409 [Physcomitrium patens]XP_024365410.1 uncharacterized protein LOC112277409 [Physcomitrium patens]XP_024365411.1 uncharacterized protein LOC112277409 [Physcomitrium patens]|eukprot:XP_024365405.1 uncharacterized protein LOC112277409 [Physcomitrella patens]